MALDPLNITAETATQLVTEIGRVGNWLQAIGVVVFVWIGFQIAFLILNRKRVKTLLTIKDDLGRMERKLNNLSKPKK